MTRFWIVALRWVALTLGIVWASLNAGCGGGGGAAGGGMGATEYLYLAGANSIAQSRILGAVDAPLSPGSVSTGSTPVAMAVAPNGAYAYVVDGSANAVYQYAITHGGTLQALSPASISLGTGTAPTSIAIDALGRYAFVAESTSIATLSIASDGTLSTAGSTSTSGTPMAVTSMGSFVFATIFSTQGNTLVCYLEGSNGSLSQAGSAALGGASVWDSPVAGGGSVCVIREGAGTNTGSVCAFALGSDGSLTSTGVLAGGNPVAGTVNANGSLAYVVDGPELRSISLTGSPADAGDVALPIAFSNALQAPFTPSAPSMPSGQVVLDPSGVNIYEAGLSATVYALPLTTTGRLAGSTSPVTSTTSPVIAAIAF